MTTREDIIDERITKAERKAARRAHERQEAYAVVSLDDGEYGRDILAVSLGYCDTDEFIAFAGRILSIHHPDGTTE